MSHLVSRRVLICDKRAKMDILSLMFGVFALGFIIIVNIAPDGMLSVLAFFVSAWIVLTILLLYLLYFRVRRRRVFNGVMCGELTDLITFLWEMLDPLTTAHTILNAVDIENVEKCLEKISKISPSVSNRILNYISNYGVIGKLRSIRNRLMLLSLIILLFIPLIILVLFITLIIGLGALHCITIVFALIAFLSYVAWKKSGLEHERLSFPWLLSKSEVDDLSELFDKLIDVISARLNRPLKLRIMMSHPTVKREKFFSIIMPKCFGSVEQYAG